MKRLIVFSLILALVFTSLAGCAKLDGMQKGLQASTEGEKSPSPTSDGDESAAPQEIDEPKTGVPETNSPLTPQQSQAPSEPNEAAIPAYDPDAIPPDGMQEGQGFVEEGTLFVKIVGIEKKLFEDQPGIVLNYELTNLSDESVDTQGALYVEVLQNGKELKHPYTFESVYLTVTNLAPKETLAFCDEYLLDSETDSVEAKIRQFWVMVSDPPWVYNTFTLN